MQIKNSVMLGMPIQLTTFTQVSALISPRCFMTRPERCNGYWMDMVHPSMVLIARTRRWCDGGVGYHQISLSMLGVSGQQSERHLIRLSAIEGV